MKHSIKAWNDSPGSCFSSHKLESYPLSIILRSLVNFLMQCLCDPISVRAQNFCKSRYLMNKFTVSSLEKLSRAIIVGLCLKVELEFCYGTSVQTTAIVSLATSNTRLIFYLCSFVFSLKYLEEITRNDPRRYHNFLLFVVTDNHLNKYN